MELTMEIVKHVFGREDGDLAENIIFSPLSINTLLGMVASRLNHGPTLERLLGLLGFKTLDDLHQKAIELEQTVLLSSPKNPDCLILSSFNGTWVDKKYALNPNFEQVLQTVYKAESFTVDFENKTREAINEINMWVKKATKGLIGEVLSEHVVNKETELIMANALYFKGFWMDEFDPSLSKADTFYKLNGKTIQALFMYSYGEAYNFASGKDFKVLRLPYGPLNWESTYEGRDFSMYVFLPNDKDELINLVDQFSSNQDLLNLNFEFEVKHVRQLKIPKFKFRYEFRVSETLESLGLVDFDSEVLEALDFGHKIASRVRSQIIHTACIGVDEYGAEAAAVTYEANMTCSMNSPPRIDFFVDHPFIFMIREDISQTPIFLGAVVNPL